ncbi:hypothetical protein GQ53DRAFT_828670 [Thozetella sp. PMI_491]|nr:hypothetical protein GQ53DRAFT_828670 [Thozetella sp. PMI_491]
MAHAGAPTTLFPSDRLCFKGGSALHFSSTGNFYVSGGGFSFHLDTSHNRRTDLWVRAPASIYTTCTPVFTNNPHDLSGVLGRIIAITSSAPLEISTGRKCAVLPRGASLTITCPYSTVDIISTQRQSDDNGSRERQAPLGTPARNYQQQVPLNVPEAPREQMHYTHRRRASSHGYLPAEEDLAPPDPADAPRPGGWHFQNW